MKILVACIFSILPLFNLVYSNSDYETDELYRNKMIKNLNLESIRLIKEGLYTFKNSGKQGIHRKLVDEWGVQIWVDPWIEAERYIDGFWIKARGINHEVINLYREKYQGYIYEFWVVKVDGKEWSDINPRVEFYVVKSSSVYGKRKILKKSDQFIEEYAVHNGHLIRFPQGDLRVLYELQAWLYPKSFEKSNLKNKKVVMDSSGNIEYEH